MPDRSRDWFTQAERDLRHAENSQRSGYHEWACFAAQQAAEKAVEALHLTQGEEVWGIPLRNWRKNCLPTCGQNTN